MENDRAGKVKKKKKEAEDMEQELLQEIASYWGTRAEGYSEVNEKELAGSQREAWLHVLEEQFPEKKKEEMKILDIGTGPGFFPMILSEAGYTVAAVDYTEEMLEKAKENLGKYTKYGLERVTLQRMDAQNLEFADETFDVVISRNLTWNLEKPEQAYQEWMRVLKPGGVLLNFDANWYGYLYDEEKKEAYEADRKKVEEQQLDDHYLCTDIDRMENIARQVPLSAMERPAWDTKVLESLGVCSIQTDSEIWKRVWSEEERLNYASTPMFLVRAEKSAEQSFQLGDVTVRRGEKYQGDDVKIETLRSTDAGVAFYVETRGATFFHAGDLNDWTWEGAGDLINGRMHREYRTQIKKLAVKPINLAFVPMDPRQGADQELGMDYFLETTSAEYVFPMHMWQDYSHIPVYKKKIWNPGMAERVVEITHENQVFLIEEQ